MTEKSERCFKGLMHLEGYGRSDDPEDSGGDTIGGCAKNYHPEWWAKISGAKTPEERAGYLRGFYYQTFWVPMRCEEQPISIAFELFEMAVNLGITGATKVLQRALQVFDPLVEVDGVAGAQTYGVLRKYRETHRENLLGVLNVKQGEAYQEIVRLHPEKKKFLLGWYKRCTAPNMED